MQRKRIQIIRKVEIKSNSLKQFKTAIVCNNCNLSCYYSPVFNVFKPNFLLMVDIM